MIKNIDIEKLQCLCASNGNTDKVAYILYPMDITSNWIEPVSDKYGITIVVITGMDWQNVFSPWPAKGVLSGSADFEGKSPEFLNVLRQKVIPHVETSLGISDNVERTLVGVSMSGLFALWQWMLCDTFNNIASLSGSLWFEGFLQWMDSCTIPHKTGKAFFLLGEQESKSKVKAFNSVGVNTQSIIALLRDAGIRTTFESVPGNHYSDPLPRLDKAFEALYK